MLFQSVDKQAFQEGIGGKPLSDLLDEVEIKLGKLKGSGDQAVQIFLMMDEVATRLADADEDSLKAARAQYEYVLADIEKNATAIIREVGGVGRFQGLRNQHHPGESQVWWFLDQHLAAKRRQSLTKALKWVGALAVILVILTIVYQKFLAPDPALIAKMDHQRSAQDAIESGDLSTALNEANKSISYAPDDASLVILKGVILQKLGKMDEANAAYQQAETMAGSSENFLLTRAMTFIQSGDPQQAIVDCQEVIKANKDSAEAYYYMGMANDSLRNTNAAIDNYQIASALAEKQNKIELAATVRMNLAMAMQSAQSMMPTFPPTETPNP
jgi:tetratricopeptide (TPR) repeat protein